MKYALFLSFVFLLSCGSQSNNNQAEPTSIAASMEKPEGIISYEEGLRYCMNLKKEGANFLSTNDCLVGSRLPKFEIESIDGKLINNAMLLGKVSVINFWFTTCPPCVAEIPGFNNIVKQYGVDKVNYISIARNSTADISAFLEDHPWAFTHISNDKNIVREVFDIQFGYPTTFIVDKEGVIVKSFSGGAMGDMAVTAIQEKILPILEKEL